MSAGLKELKRLAYENACCRCQYYIDHKCTNKGECVWKTIENELKDQRKRLTIISEILVDISKGNYSDLKVAIKEIREVLEK